MATTFIAEAYTPSATSVAELEARARRAADELARAGTRIRYLHSIFVAEDETCFHLFEAASADVVRQAIERASLGPHRIVAATTQSASDLGRESR
jgi:hypothetical protein